MVSRFSSATLVLPDPLEQNQNYINTLRHWLQQHQCDVVFACSDEGAAALDVGRKILEPLTRIALAAPSAFASATSKEATLDAARRVGVPVPNSRVVSSEAETIAAASEVGYPVVLKPISTWRPLSGNRGEVVTAAYITDAAAAAKYAGRLVRPEAPALVQEYATGQRVALMAVRDSEGLHGSFAMEASRTWPPLGGNSVMRRSIPIPSDCLRHTTSLLSELDYQGYAEVEFRRDADGQPLLMEINARFSQSLELAQRSGLDLVSGALSWARNEPLEPVVGTFRPGAALSWPLGEAFLLQSALRDSGLRPRPRLRQILHMQILDYLRLPRLDGVQLNDLHPVVLTALLYLKQRRQSQV